MTRLSASNLLLDVNLAASIAGLWDQSTAAL